MSDKMIVKNIENVDVLLEGLDPENITSILNKCDEISEVRKKLEEVEEMLKAKVKAYLKERSWTNYNDPTNKITVSLVTQKREDIDKGQLKLMLNESQYQQVIKVVSFEKLMIISPKTKQRMRNYIR